ncbi:MAG: glycosyltransferase family 4 protein [Proteobacteria bacterium]|nr:glycosyltransferase family 4 protein [Pseudomonadota bacterium]MBU1449337.1 glycosyltransferase family 4 protein [Pseudomonadota bacterium]MBU2470264.1 glycosyltransferase family 4 protein [Pseudomonadota bacterium]MBU2519364.1 glycosyltransferase family 4 protein [Pseudomonadota bacterium]
MRLMHLHERLSARGGAERHLISLLKHQQGRHQTLLAVGFDDGSLPPPELEAIGPWQRVKGLARRGLRLRGERAARRRLAEAVASFQPDLIHIHNLMDPCLLELAARAAPAVMTVQDHRLFCPGRGKLTAQGRSCSEPLGRACLACFDQEDYGRRMLELTRRRLAAMQGLARVLVLSRYMDRQLALVGVDPARLAVLPPPVDLPPAGTGAKRGYHLLAGRLVGRKGVGQALAAAQMLKHPLPLLVAGDGPLADEVARAARTSGGRLGFEGWADRARMSRLLSGAASLWLPSLWAEPWGIVGLEALARGTPVVGTRVGGVPEWLLPGEHGILVPPGDPAALARAADDLAGDPEQARRMGRAGRAWVARHMEGEGLMRRLERIYQEALAREAA